MSVTAAINMIQNSFQSTNVTTHTVTVPAGYAAGNMGLLAIMFSATSGGTHPGTVSSPAGWTLTSSKILTGSGGNYGEVYCYTKLPLGVSEAPVVFTTANAVTSAAVYFDISGIKNIPNAFVLLNNAEVGAMNSSLAAAQTITTNATEVLLIDLLSVLGGASAATQSTSNWTTNSGSTVWSIAYQTVTSVSSYTGPSWSWTDATHRYAALRLALPTVNGNIQPVAKIGSGYSIFGLPGQQLNLTSASFDFDGTVSSYQWTNISSYDTGLPVIANAASATCNLTLPTATNTVYQIGLTVVDNSGLASVPASIGIMVQDVVGAQYVRAGGAWKLSARYQRKNSAWH